MQGPVQSLLIEAGEAEPTVRQHHPGAEHGQQTAATDGLSEPVGDEGQ